MTELKRLHKKWSRAGLKQTQVAKRIKTSQSVVARLERGASMPLTRTLQRYAKATGSRLTIRFEPARAE
jgi:transcriptional regulator with XRE-family HTH domain